MRFITLPFLVLYFDFKIEKLLSCTEGVLISSVALLFLVLVFFSFLIYFLVPLDILDLELFLDFIDFWASETIDLDLFFKEEAIVAFLWDILLEVLD